MATLRILIKGKVQGVFYRQTAKKIADKLDIKGWVKNNLAGEVEAVVTGNDPSLQAFIEWCKQGPERAEVSEVITSKLVETPFDDFTIKR
jgi:acylphosphatase